MSILVNNKKVDIKRFDLPVLISAKCGGGASYFSIAFIAELINSGQKVLYFCKAQPGVDQLKQFVTDDILKERAVIIDPGDTELFKKALNQKKDVQNRVIFVKNIEDILDLELFNLIKPRKGFVLSGDVDLCDAISSNKNFATSIFFTNSQKFKVKLSVEIDKYKGELQSNSIRGIVEVGS